MERLPAPETILETIYAYRRTAPSGSCEVAFFGGTFTMLPASEQSGLLAPLSDLIRSGAVSSVRISTRPDAIDLRIAKFLLKNGVKTVELGVQSMDDKVLAATVRGHTSEDVRNAVSTLKDAGIAVGIQLMPGLPASTPEKDLESLEDALALNPDLIRIYPALVLAGTGLAVLYESGGFSPLSLKEAVNLSAAMLHRCMRADVPVIRIGLQASDSLQDPGNLISGPYHPAFRQLVESELCHALLNRMFKQIPAGTKCMIRCAPSRVSDVVGQKRANLMRMAEGGIRIEKVEADSQLSQMEFVILAASGEVRGNLLTDIEFNSEGKLYV